MAIEPEWTDPDTLEVTTLDYATVAWANALLGNLAFLAEPPSVAVRLTASQEVVDSADHTISWDAAVWSGNGDSMWDVSAPSKVVVQRDGMHLVDVSIEWAANISLDDLVIELEVDGVLRDSQKGDHFTLHTNVAALESMEIIVRQTSGAAVNMLDTLTRMTVDWTRIAPSGASA